MRSLSVVIESLNYHYLLHLYLYLAGYMMSFVKVKFGDMKEFIQDLISIICILELQ